ncbi:hypothetical protein AURDEDRAFT_162460 [Auricularia subglabra TFB-10046 SS5]|nr:hypothetical protein AURDEDRAFT_162460 [Auricularia subglabra TFB-10046 SS5]
MASAVGLPNELLEQIFDHLPAGVPSIVCASHVCKRWRHLASQHPKFCRDISITDSGAGEREIPEGRIGVRVECLAAQLASSEQPIDVTIRLCQEGAEMIEAALPLLPAHMHRVASFSFVSYRGHSWQGVVALLDAPTPLLESLRIDAGDDGWMEESRTDEMILPRSFLCGKERLRSLSLRLFTFPDDAIRNASIDQLGLCLPDQDSLGVALDACPRIRRLDLSFRLGLYGRDLLPVIHDTRVANLTTLSISQASGVLFYYAAVLETHLRGPLRITEFFCNEHLLVTSFDITLCDAASTRQRLFLGTILDLDEPYSDSLDVAEFRGLCIGNRLVELRACVNSIKIVAALLPSLPVLEVFVVALRHYKAGTPLYPEPRSEAWHTFDAVGTVRSARVVCPVLTKLVIEGEGWTCSTSWLAHFAGHVLGVTPRRKLELVLHGASLIGDPQEIRGHFHSISMYPSEQ